MNTFIEGHVFSAVDICSGMFHRCNLEAEALELLHFMQDWFAGKSTFAFQTSGSTGKTKTIHLTRELLNYSATQTLHHLGLNGTNKKSFFLPISPQFIGGKMVAVRAMVSSSDLTVVSPQGLINPSAPHDLTSMVPLQLKKIINESPDTLGAFKNILIGGAPLSQDLEKSLLEESNSNHLYHTYGMTETASHVALRRLGNDHFEAIGDAVFKIDHEKALCIKGTITNNQWLQTNDLVELVSDKAFRWIGRKDFIINTGGHKVNPEKVEGELASQFSNDFIITSLPHASFGQQVVLVSEGKAKSLKLDSLHPYERPKQLFFNHRIVKTTSGKINRLETQKSLLEKNL